MLGFNFNGGAALEEHWVKCGVWFGRHSSPEGFVNSRDIHSQMSTPLLFKPPPIKHETLTQCWFNIGPASPTLRQHETSIGSTCLLGQHGFLKYQSHTLLCSGEQRSWYHRRPQLSAGLTSDKLVQHCAPVVYWPCMVISEALTNSCQSCVQWECGGVTDVA